MAPQLPVGRFCFWIGLVVFALSQPGAATAQTKPQRIVSLNLCADQLLLALADRDQIASLSPLAADHAISFLAAASEGIPRNSGKGESILFSGADLILAGTFGQQARTALLKGQGFEVLALEPWRNLEHGRQQIRHVARRLGHPDRGEKLIAEIDDSLARTKDMVPDGRSVLVYYRRGYVPASDSLVSEILQHMGFRLQQEKLGLPRGGIARLEAIVSTPPDYLLMDEAVGRSVDNGSALLTHPALARIAPAEKRLLIPGNLAICGGPSTPATIKAIASEIEAKVR